MIHQSISNSMRMTAMPLERRRCGGSIRKALFVALLLSLFVLLMPSHPVLHLYDTSIYQEFDEDYGNSFVAA
jgi:hypothetical protein